MPEFRTSDTIRSPLGHVWAFVTDVGKNKRWISGLKSVEVLGGGAIGKGRWIRETRTTAGRTHTLELQVTEFEPERQLQLTAPHAGSDFVYTITLAPQGDDSTRVELITEIRPRNLFGRACAPLGMMMMKKHDASLLPALKHAIEAA